MRSLMLVALAAGLAHAAPRPKEKDPPTPFVRWFAHDEFASNEPHDPIVVGDRVIVGTDKGELRAYRCKDGELLWTQNYGGRLFHRPSSDGRRIYFMSNRGLTAAAAEDGTEAWATKLTETSATLPAYSTSATNGSEVIFIWSQYAHNGRIAFDGANYAGYFGAAITVPGQACVAPSTLSAGVNIHQGDRMKVVNGSGAIQSSGFDWGCSHSGYERVAWDGTAKKFVGVCKNDLPTGGKSGRLAFAPGTTIIPVDLNYNQLGTVMPAGGGGYWLLESDIRAGQPASANGLADIHLLHVASTSSPTPNQDIALVSDGLNDRAPHLAAYGASRMVAAWETSTATGDFSQNAAGRQMWIQVLDATTGMAPAGATATAAGPLKLSPNVLGSRYQDFRAYPDGSVAYPAPGSSGTKIKIMRVLGCS